MGLTQSGNNVGNLGNEGADFGYDRVESGKDIGAIGNKRDDCCNDSGNGNNECRELGKLGGTRRDTRAWCGNELGKLRNNVGETGNPFSAWRNRDVEAHAAKW
jgi:hypothetical protein